MQLYFWERQWHGGERVIIVDTLRHSEVQEIATSPQFIRWATEDEWLVQFCRETGRKPKRATPKGDWRKEGF